MIPRDIKNQLLKLSKSYPVVALMGPRQAGKTTLARKLFPEKPYVNLEFPDLRLLAELDPRGFLAQYPEGAILDEIQEVPSLLSYIQGIVDETQLKGMYILTGSHQLGLHQNISQSLAGRVGLLTLLPFSITELRRAAINLDLNEYLLSGFLPRIYDQHLDPVMVYRDYLKTYVERDVRQLIHIKDLSTFQRFLKLCAGRIGSVLNMNNLANEVGVSNHTIKSWLSILEASFVIYLLPPYFENFSKRVIKSPKLYFYDVGLASYLLDLENIKQIDRDPLRGNLIENLVISELYKTRLNQGKDAHLYYYRDVRQNEVDVIYKQGHDLIPIEIKAAATIHPRFLDGLEYFTKLTEGRSPKQYLIYTGKEEMKIHECQILQYKHCDQVFEEESL